MPVRLQELDGSAVQFSTFLPCPLAFVADASDIGVERLVVGDIGDVLRAAAVATPSAISTKALYRPFVVFAFMAADAGGHRVYLSNWGFS
jgi:hypothetical protein